MILIDLNKKLSELFIEIAYQSNILIKLLNEACCSSIKQFTKIDLETI